MPLHSGSWLQDILALIPFLMTGQLKRSTDFGAALFGKIAVALVVSLLTGAAGGAIGAYVALHIQDYRITQLERHEAEDREQFRKVQAEIEAVKERHRLDDLRSNGKTP